MELPRVNARLVTFAALLTALLCAVVWAPGAGAKTTTSAQTDPNTPVLVLPQDAPPRGYRLTAARVRRIAARAPKIVAELRRHPRAISYEYTKGPGRWQVSWFSPGARPKELAQVYVGDASGKVTEAWTGFQVAWTMARGYSGAFGRRVNAWYVWIPMCLLFALPFLPWRRRPSLLHLDLAVLLAFSISLAFFNQGKIGISVPFAYPFLLYLFVRMLLLAFGRGRPREPLRLIVPVSWLAVGIVFLVAFRIGLNVTDSNVIDVGYAGVIGADKVVHDEPLYGGWPHDNANGDTYGPVTYLAYVPFREVFGWSGRWDDLPAAHAAAVFFDVLTLLGLFLLGRRVRGPTTGIVLAYAWAAYPFTLYALASDSNDALVPLLIVLALLLAASPAARGALAAVGGPDQVRAAGAGTPVPARDRRLAAQALTGRLPRCLRGGWRPGDASGAAAPRPSCFLGGHDLLPVRPGFTVLGVGFVGWPWPCAASAARRRGRACAGRRLRATAPRARRGRGARSCCPDRPPAGRVPLVLSLHPVVLPAGDARARPGPPAQCPNPPCTQARAWSMIARGRWPVPSPR